MSDDVREIEEPGKATRPSELREREALAQEVFESSALSTWISDHHGTAIRTNPACLAFFGATEEEVIGKYNVFKDRVIIEQGFLPVVERVFTLGETATFEMDYDFAAVDHVQVKNATHKWIKTVLTPLMDGAGQVTNVIVQTIDLTEITRARNALQEALRRQEQAVAAGNIGLWDWDLATGKVWFSREWKKQIGYAPEEITDSFAEWESRVHPEDLEAAKRNIQTMLEGSLQYHPIDFRFRHKDGSYRWILARATAIIGEDGQPERVIGTHLDITERKNLEAQVSQADRLSSMGTLAAGVAHEINNPLTYVLYNVESLTQDLRALGPAVARLVDALGPDRVREILGDDAELVAAARLSDLRSQSEDAEEGAYRVRDIVKALRTFTRVDEDRRVPVSLNDIIDSALEMANNELRFRAKVVRNYEQLPALVANDGKLAQVFLNLLINAAHAIPEGAAEDNKIALRTWVDGDHVVAEVRDTGKGISAADLSRIFDPFFTTKAIGEGSGLGLSICHNIVTELGGTITVESEVGEGTQFCVRLPISAAQTTSTAPSSEFPAVGSARRGRILIVDDEPHIGVVLERMLAEEHDTVFLSSALEAKRLLEQDQAFDGIVCDLMMPSMTGMDLHAWLAEQYPTLAKEMIFVSGGAFTPKARDFLARVPNARLEKPFAPKNLKALLRERLR